MVEAVNYSSMSRDQIKENLLAVVMKHLEAADSYKEIDEDAKYKMKITQGEEQGVAITICRMEGAGLSVEEFKEWHKLDSMMDNMSKLDDIITGKRLDDHDGLPLIYQHVKTPMMVSNRVSLFSVYEWEEDGAYCQLSTSRGNEKYAEEHPDLVGKNVLCDVLVTYVKFSPKADGSGVDCVAVICVDPAGSLPDFVKNQIAKSNGDNTVKLVKRLQKEKGI